MFVNNISSKNIDKYYVSNADMTLTNNTSNKDDALKLINVAISQDHLNYETWKFKLLLDNKSKKENDIPNTINELSSIFSEYLVIKNDILYEVNKENRESKFLGL